MLKMRAGRPCAFAWSALIGALISTSWPPPLLPTLIGTAAIFLVALATYVYNDVMDLEFDKLSHRERPLVSGVVSKRQALNMTVASAIGAIVLSVSLNLGAFFLALAGLVLAYAYSTPPFNFKDRFLLKHVATALGVAISNFLGGVAVGGLRPTVLYGGGIFFILSMVLAALADMGDMDSDLAAGRRTLPIVMGPVFTVRLAAVVVVSLSAVTALTFHVFGFNNLFPILVGAICFGSMRLLQQLHQHRSDTRYCQRMVKKLYLLHLILQASLVIGAY